MPLITGQVLQDRYRIVSLLGQGGMGAVYRAWDLRLKKPVALKEMVSQPDLDSAALAQFRTQFGQEAMILAQLSHPHLVPVSDYFEEQGNDYLVMAFIEGEDLADRIAREGMLPEAQVLAWAAQLLDALGYCHERRVIHRDIKPQNVIVTPENKAVLVDFGLVKLWDPNDPRTKTAVRGYGTPEYAPLEQSGTSGAHTGPHSDIYSLAATLYHALVGQAPPAVTDRLLDPGSLKRPTQVRSDVSVRTEAAILKAMEVQPGDRFPTAEAMRCALTVIEQGQADGGKVLISSGRAEQRRRWGWAVGVLAATVLLTLVAGRLAVTLGSDGVLKPGMHAGQDSHTPTPAPSPSASPVAKSTTIAVPERTSQPARSNTYVLYILDASSGMLRPWNDGETKLTGAKRALVEHWVAVGHTLNVGLRVYGHRYDVWDDTTCQDTELLVPLGLGQIAKLADQLQGVQAVGLDAPEAALRETLGDFVLSPRDERKHAIVLVTDGQEPDDRCGDLSAVTVLVGNQRDTGIVLPIYVVGLDVPADQEPHYRTIADISGGQYYRVGSVDELERALHSVITAASDASR